MHILQDLFDNEMISRSVVNVGSDFFMPYPSKYLLLKLIPDFDSKSGFPQKNINDIQESVWGIIKV